jgi:hypothetical protein
MLRGALGLTAALGTAATVSLGSASRASAYGWTRTLQQGDSGSDVKTEAGFGPAVLDATTADLHSPWR